MTVFAERLRARIKALSLTHAEVARRASLDPRRFGHYATGLREPDFRTLLKIATVLGTTPNVLLGVENAAISNSTEATLRLQIGMACEALAEPTLRIVLAQVGAVVALSRKSAGLRSRKSRRAKPQ